MSNHVMSSENSEEIEIKPLAATVGREKEEIEVETRTSKKNVFFWAMYDLANTIYSMVIVSLIINKYILVIGQKEHGLSYGDTSLIFGIVSGVMQALVAICVPILGALSDTAGKRKPYVISLTGIILLFASLIGFSRNITIVLTLYVIANIAYQFSLVFYDAMLPFIAKKEDMGKVAGFGVAWGYLGTIVALLVLLPIIIKYGNINSFVENPANLSYGFAGEWITFVIPMGLFFILGLPIIWVKEKQKKTKTPPFRDLLTESFTQVKQTFRDIRNHRQLFMFIIGYFFVSNVANVLVAYMLPLVTDGLRIGTMVNGTFEPSDLFGTIYIIISTVSAVAFTYSVGQFAEKHGAKKGFFLIGALWGISITIGIILILTSTPILIGLNIPFIFAIIMGLIAGPALGGTWTSQRVMITELAPKEKFGEYFGFSKLSGKVSSSIGPIIFGSILKLTDIPSIGNKAYAIALFAVGIIMAFGTFIISFVRSEESGRNY